MNLDVQAMLKAMVAASAGPLVGYNEAAHGVAAHELSTISCLIVKIGEARQSETITPKDAAALLAQAKLDSKSAMDTEGGIRAMAAEDAINAALGAVASIVNGYLGFALI